MMIIGVVYGDEGQMAAVRVVGTAASAYDRISGSTDL